MAATAIVLLGKILELAHALEVVDKFGRFEKWSMSLEFTNHPIHMCGIRGFCKQHNGGRAVKKIYSNPMKCLMICGF
jgi:hypothetical protein